MIDGPITDESEDLEYGLTQEAFDNRIQDARDAGFEVIEPGLRRLLIDLDGPERGVQFECLLPIVDRLWGPVEVERWPSKSGKPGHEHVLVKMAISITVEARLLLQAVLGSDPKRELLALGMLWNGIEEPSRLFRPRPVNSDVAP